MTEAAFVGVRFIPTPVGSTRTPRAKRTAATVHPHARGEHGVGTVAEVHDVRFIPTPVGSTAAPTPPPNAKPVHPHARGEHWCATRMATRQAGSSPRPWGALEGDDVLRGGVRFIPTPVGST